MPILWDETGVVIGAVGEVRGLSLGAQVRTLAGASVSSALEADTPSEDHMIDQEPRAASLRLVKTDEPEQDHGMEMLAKVFLFGGVVAMIALVWWLA